MEENPWTESCLRAVRYIKEIVSDLPMEEDEKADFIEELYTHLKDHVNELLIKGYTEEEAITCFQGSYSHESSFGIAWTSWRRLIEVMLVNLPNP